MNSHTDYFWDDKAVARLQLQNQRAAPPNLDYFWDDKAVARLQLQNQRAAPPNPVGKLLIKQISAHQFHLNLYKSPFPMNREKY
jgi:hypothetical protein